MRYRKCVYKNMSCEKDDSMKANMRLLVVILMIFGNLHAQAEPNKTDLVIFSFDRPLQLYALLESVEEYVTGLASIQVIYRTSNEQYEKAYTQVKNRFNTIAYIPQGPNPAADFKPLTIRAAFDSPGDYIMFAVDDDIIKDYVDVNECVSMLEKYRAYGFYLWLGKHISYCYPEQRAQKVPHCTTVEPNVCAWNFKDGECDWHYPHTVDLALYRKKDIEHYFKNLHYTAPNNLEGHWAGSAQAVIASKYGLFYETSKMVNLPLNRVQNIYQNRSMNFMTPAQMLELFNAGKKIDIKPLYQIKNNDPHMIYEPTFIERN